MKDRKIIYVDLYEQFKQLIKEGKYVENQKLPSKRKLASSLKISPLTVEKAYLQLELEGYVYTIEKKGYFVSKRVEILIGKPYETKNAFYETKSSNNYLYEFRTNVVDTSLFPNSIWAKLSREVLSENHHEMLNITHPQGMIELRSEISKYLGIYRGMKVDPRQIVIGSGSSTLISLIVQILGRQKKYAMENPGYHKIFNLLKGNDVNLTLIKLDESGLNTEEVKEKDVDIIHITPSHQFPTGNVMPIQRRNELLNWAYQKESRYIIEDDYDSEFRFKGKPIPALSGLDYHDKVIYMNTFTKTLAPSFRMSYMVLPFRLLDRYIHISSFHGSTVPNFEQYIMYKFMSGGYFERHLNRMKNLYNKKLELIINLVNKEEGFEIINDDTGLHFLLQIHRNIDEVELEKALINNKIYVKSLTSYYLNNKISHQIPTLVIGYSGILIEKVEDAFYQLIKQIKELTK
jgi:GntR family transcriptional regulator / MocR family aminotransferase